MTPTLGILEWFVPGEHERVERVLDDISSINVAHLRTGVSWADWYTDAGQVWYDWLIPRLAREVVILPCFLYTPPSIAIRPRTSSPPRVAHDYADWLDMMLTRYGKHFEHVELWNEPNNVSEWDWTLDPGWHIFCSMAGAAAYWAKQRGWKTVLGGMSPVDPNWLRLVCTCGVVEYIDAVGIHAFPGVWEPNWAGWSECIGRVHDVLDEAGYSREVWITETGYSTWKRDELRQVRAFDDCMKSDVQRVYWYAAQDLHANRPTIDGFHEDEREYHFGLAHSDGQPKLLQRLLSHGGSACVGSFLESVATEPSGQKPVGVVLITGGLGFIGSHLARHLLEQGRRVRILDDVSSASALENLFHLRRDYPDLVEVWPRDIRESYVFEHALAQVTAVFYCAAVNATQSNRSETFDINARSVVALADALRSTDSAATVVFLSTSEVYGRSLAWLAPVREATPVRPRGAYACSKAAAEHWLLSEARDNAITAMVLRMGAVYGMGQSTRGEGGWVLELFQSALHRTEVTLPHQDPRDILHVDDCVQALALAEACAEQLTGEIWNVGGIANQSMDDWVRSITRAVGQAPMLMECVEATPVRPRVDSSGFQSRTGWSARVTPGDGIAELADALGARETSFANGLKGGRYARCGR